MKSTALVIASSLTLNLILAFALFTSRRPQPTRTEAEPPGPETDTGALLIQSPKPSDPAANTGVPIQTFSWQSVESQDYLTYIENLRSIGCPEETIRDIITADVNKLYEQRWKEAKEEMGATRFEYWKGNAMFGMNSNQRKAYKQIDDERRAALKSLLGQNVPRRMSDLAAMFDPYESMLGFLPESKRTAIIELQQQMGERMMDAAQEGNQLDPADMKKVEDEQKEALAKLLTREELLEYNLRMSNSSHMLRSELGTFEVTEQEFRDLYALREAFEEEYGTFGPTDDHDAQEWHANRSAGEQDLKTAYEEVLGDDRYRQFKHEQTLRGSSLRKVAKEFDLPREEVYQIFEVTDVAQEAAQQIRRDDSLSEADRQSALDRIRAETEAEVTRVIGDEAARSYIDQGSRIRNLNQRGAAPNVTSSKRITAPAIRVGP